MMHYSSMSSLIKDVSAWASHLEQRRPTLYFLADLALNILIIIVLVFGVRNFLISPFQVFGPSMCNSLNFLSGRCQDAFGEYLIVNKAVYYPFFGRSYKRPQRGDIVVFRPPNVKKDFYIKRVVGLPGETVKIQNGRVYVNDKELNESYLSNENRNQTFPFPAHLVATYAVPANMYFVMGDNRKKSSDSRTCFAGAGDRYCNDPTHNFLPFEAIEGKAWVVLWPFNKIRLLENPAY